MLAAVPVALLLLTACGGSGSAGAPAGGAGAATDAGTSGPTAAGSEAATSTDAAAGTTAGDGGGPAAPAGPAPTITENVTMKKDPVHPCTLVSQQQIQALSGRTVSKMIRTYTNEGGPACEYLFTDNANGDVWVGYERDPLTAATLRQLVEPFEKIGGGTFGVFPGLGNGAFWGDNAGYDLYVLRGKRAFTVRVALDKATDKQKAVTLVKQVMAAKAARKL